MTKAMRKITAILLSVLLCCSAVTSFPVTAFAAETNSDVGESGTTGDCTWTLDDDGTLTVSGSGIMGNYFYRETPWGDRVTSVVIEDGVTSVGSYAFYDCKKLTSVTIPDSVTNIGNNAFEYCTGLTSVTIPDSVTYIGEQAFSDCTGLTSVTIPDGVTSIAFQTFCNCMELTSVTIPESVTSIGYEAFTGCWELTGVYIRDLAAWCSISFGDSSANPLYNANKLYLNNELVTDLVIPDSVTSIGDYTFPGCTGLTSVTIPDSVTSIGSFAFCGCTGLTSVTIPDSVTSIGNNAFNDCTELTSVTIPDSVTSIGERAFGYYYDYYDRNYKKIDPFTIYGYAGSAADDYAKENEFAFVAVGNTPEPTDPTEPVPHNGTTGDCTWTFDDATGTLTIRGNGEMGDYYIYDFDLCIPAPWGGLGVKTVVIENGVTKIGECAFSYCAGLTSVTIPDSVTGIGEWAFYGCTGLKSVTIPGSVTSIDKSAFDGCTGLTSVTIPDSVTSIGTSVFAYCTELTSVTIPDSVTSIGECAFQNCTGLTSVTIPDSVISIGDAAFYGCRELTSVTIPESVTKIGENAFGFYFDEEEYLNKKVDSFTIYGKKGSAAEAYANENGFAFIETEPQTVVTGDVNGDDKVNGADAGLLNRYTSGWEGYADKIKDMDAADLNRDGKVNGADAGILNRYTSGWTGYDKYIQTVTK